MDHTVIGMFNSFEDAQHVVDHLVKSGFNRDDISLVTRNQGSDGTAAGDNANTNSGEDAVKAGQGAGFGAVVGALTGVLVGLGALAIPGIGPVLAAGPLISALGGGAVGAVTGAATGGIVAALVKTGLPEQDAQYYAEGIRRGGTLVSVNTNDDQVQTALDIMNEHGAMDVHQQAEQWRSGGWNGFDENASPYTETSGATSNAGTEANLTRNAMSSNVTSSNTTSDRNQQERVLPVVEEQLQVGKREVERGGVRAYQRVTEKPVEEQVNLREERVNVERRPVDRPVTATDQNAFQETTIEMTERSEEPVVAKQVRVIEEVVLSKDVNERAETIRDTVRRADVEVENLSGNQQSAATSGVQDFDTYTTDFRNNYTSNYGQSGYTYEQYSPAYRYGYMLANDPNGASDWTMVEPVARQRWEERNQGTWENFKDAVRYAWDKVRGARSASTR